MDLNAPVRYVWSFLFGSAKLTRVDLSMGSSFTHLVRTVFDGEN